MLLVAVMLLGSAYFPNEIAANATATGDLSVGDIIEFGSYPQTDVSDIVYTGKTVTLNNKTYAVEPIKWRVLRITDDKALLLTEKIVDGQQFNLTSATVNGIPANNYTHSLIRHWLTETFYNMAFSTNEKSALIETQLEESTDSIFLLSKSEAETYASKYFATTATDYSYANGFVTINTSNHWFTRTAGPLSYQVYYVEKGRNNYVVWRNDFDDCIGNGKLGVRPALYIDIEAYNNSQSNLLKDSDGDAIPDNWETEGVDFDNNGIIDLDLPAMGADPDVPDVFVEVDWMVRPNSKKVLFWEVQFSKSFKPSEKAMKMVYEAFKNASHVYGGNGINLHIDAGPDSTDFVTGKKWGDLSGGNEIAYIESLALNRNTQIWENLIDIEENRKQIFHHCIFGDRLFGPEDGTSGVTPGFGQFFAVTLGDAWTTNKMIAGTFMHELGHSLGLHHGGCDDANYKPNYLSIMNYAYQFIGLKGTGELDYSSFSLPDIDEANINEKLGIDPEGKTDGTGLKAILYSPTERTTAKISKAEIDFNGNKTIDENTYSLDLNPDGNISDEKPITVLKGHFIDWEHINYKSGEIGSVFAEGDSVELLSLDAEIYEEKTIEEALRTSTLADNGTGGIEMVASTIIKDIDNQNIYFDVINLGSEDATYAITVSCDALFSVYETDIFVPGSKTKIEKTRISIPVNTNVEAGAYEISCSLSYPETEDVAVSYTIEVYAPSEDELELLSEYVADSDADLDDDILQEMQNVIKQTTDISEPETPDTPADDDNSCTCICHSENSIVQFFYIIFRFLWQLFGMNMDCACGVKHFDFYIFA